MSPSHADVDSRRIHKDIDRCIRAEQHALRRRLRKLDDIEQVDKRASQLEQLQKAVATSQARRSHRLSHIPDCEYPAELPIVAHRDKIIKTIAANPVTIICGETGSGKTTQIPKMCLEAGCGREGMIGHTQPRRIAARSVSSRIASELKTELGNAVGYKVRFNDKLSDNTYIKLMTDGILLAEIQSDPWLNQYDTIIAVSYTHLTLPTILLV